MRDLTISFAQALDSHHPWDPREIASAVASLVQREGGRVSWAPEAGEEWICLVTATGENYALIWTRAPLAICVPTVSSALLAFLNNRGVVSVEAADWNAPDFCIDPGPIQMRGIPGFWPVPSYEAPTTRFSILDLMWVTI